MEIYTKKRLKIRFLYDSLKRLQKCVKLTESLLLFPSPILQMETTEIHITIVSDTTTKVFINVSSCAFCAFCPHFLSHGYYNSECIEGVIFIVPRRFYLKL